MTILSGFWDAFSSMKSTLYLKSSKKRKSFNSKYKKVFKATCLSLPLQPKGLKGRVRLGASPSRLLSHLTSSGLATASQLHRSVLAGPTDTSLAPTQVLISTAHLHFSRSSPPPAPAAFPPACHWTPWSPSSFPALQAPSLGALHSRHPLWAGSLIRAALVITSVLLSPHLCFSTTHFFWALNCMCKILRTSPACSTSILHSQILKLNKNARPLFSPNSFLNPQLSKWWHQPPTCPSEKILRFPFLMDSS